MNNFIVPLCATYSTRDKDEICTISVLTPTEKTELEQQETLSVPASAKIKFYSCRCQLNGAYTGGAVVRFSGDGQRSSL